jgi:hypothetical protein
MVTLIGSLNSWGSDTFSQTLKTELEGLESGVLPLDKAALRGGAIDDSDISVTVINVSDNERFILAKVGVFFHEVSAGGACGDDPMMENAYCVLQVSIDKTTADAQFTVVYE